MKWPVLIKESLVATALIFLITFALSFFPFKFEFVKLIPQGIANFDIYDLYYSGRAHDSTTRDPEILVVQIGEDRNEISEQVELLSQYKPSVIGLDAFFEEEKDSAADERMRAILQGQPNIVLAYRMVNDKGNLNIVPNIFATSVKATNIGFANFIGSDKYSVVREYTPFHKVDDQTYYSFPSAILKLHNPKYYEKLLDRNNSREIINFKGNLEKYTTLSREELLHYWRTQQLKSIVENKIVLLGYFTKNEPAVILDLHFTPVNEQVTGKSIPDMYGVVIQANIISMILNDRYATFVPEWVSYLLATLISFLILVYMLRSHYHHNNPSHGKLIVIQFCLIIVLPYLLLVFYRLFLIKVALLPLIVSIVVSFEMFGIYKSLARWMNKRFHYTTIFATKHHS